MKLRTISFSAGIPRSRFFGGLEVARLRRTWLIVLAICVVVFEIAVVLVLRAHYTMDVFTGALAAMYVAQICRNIPDQVPRIAAGRTP